MRASNAEWDFMGRSFLVWSLANMSLREPASKALYLQTVDQIIEETIRLEEITQVDDRVRISSAYDGLVIEV